MIEVKKRKRRWKSPISKKDLKIVYECWRKSSTKRECLALTSSHLPNISPPVIWGTIRKLIKIDKQWILTLKEKEDQKKQLLIQKEEKRKERLANRNIKEKNKEWKNRKKSIRNKLNNKHLKKLQDKIKFEFFFCLDMHQQVNNFLCIYRVFSNNGNFSHCNSCKRMDKYISILEEVIEDDK